jgi:hypothetical protein
MFGSETIRILIIVSYVLIFFSTVTGLLKLAFKNNEVITLLHKMSGPVLNGLFLIFFVVSTFYFGAIRVIPRMIIVAVFVTVLYAGVTGIRKGQQWMLILHRILGILAFSLFTMLLVVFLIL